MIVSYRMRPTILLFASVMLIASAALASPTLGEHAECNYIFHTVFGLLPTVDRWPWHQKRLEWLHIGFYMICSGEIGHKSKTLYCQVFRLKNWKAETVCVVDMIKSAHLTSMMMGTRTHSHFPNSSYDKWHQRGPMFKCGDQKKSTLACNHVYQSIIGTQGHLNMFLPQKRSDPQATWCCQP